MRAVGYYSKGRGLFWLGRWVNLDMHLLELHASPQLTSVMFSTDNCSYLTMVGSVSSLSMPSPSSANASCKARLHSTPCVRTPPRVFSDATVTDFTQSGYHFPRRMCDTKQYSEASTSEMSFSTYNDEDSDDDDDDSNDAYGNTLTKLFLGYIEDFNSVSPHREELRVKSAKLPTAGKIWCCNSFNYTLDMLCFNMFQFSPRKRLASARK